MIYSLYFSIDDVYGPGGAISTQRGELISQAADLARVGLDMLGDWASDADWFDESGELVGPEELLQSKDEDALARDIEQISDALKGQRAGFIDIREHEDLFALIDYHHMTQWMPAQLLERIAAVRAAYQQLASDLSDEWEAS